MTSCPVTQVDLFSVPYCRLAQVYRGVIIPVAVQLWWLSDQLDWTDLASSASLNSAQVVMMRARYRGRPCNR